MNETYEQPIRTTFVVCTFLKDTFVKYTCMFIRYNKLYIMINHNNTCNNSKITFTCTEV